MSCFVRKPALEDIFYPFTNLYLRSEEVADTEKVIEEEIPENVTEIGESFDKVTKEESSEEVTENKVKRDSEGVGDQVIENCREVVEKEAGGVEEPKGVGLDLVWEPEGGCEEGTKEAPGGGNNCSDASDVSSNDLSGPEDGL